MDNLNNKSLIVLIVIILFVIIFILYSFQEYIVFLPEKLNSNHIFKFDGENKSFEEIWLKTNDGINLNALLFKSGVNNSSVILYLHGNAGNNENWGYAAKQLSTRYNIDVLILDYRGFGKSGGEISNETMLYDDAAVAYNYLKEKYNNIIVIGNSIGTGIATKIAADNNVKKLILISPYYNLIRLSREKTIKLLPSWLIKYKLMTNENIRNVSAPVIIFHANDDDIIPVQHSIDLKKENNNIELNIIENTTHNDIHLTNDFHKLIQPHLLK